MTKKDEHIKYVDDLGMLSKEGGKALAVSMKRLIVKLLKKSRNRPEVFTILLDRSRPVITAYAIMLMKKQFNATRSLGREFGKTK